MTIVSSMSTKKFLNNGYYQFENTISKDECIKFNRFLKKNYKINKNIFLSEKDFLNNKKKYKNLNPSNVLDKYDTSFLFENNNFSSKLELLLGKDYLLCEKKVICSVPAKLYPKWIDRYQPANIPNLTPYLKPHYRDLRFFKGADFHQDLMDHPKHKANFMTVYIYLDKVTNSMSPLILLPKTHYIGPEAYPHNLELSMNKFRLKSKKNKIIKGNQVTIIGEAGTVWGWHTCLLHGTIPNKNIKPRYSIRLIYRQTKNQKSLIKSVNSKLPSLIAPSKMY